MRNSISFGVSTNNGLLSSLFSARSHVCLSALPPARSRGRERGRERSSRRGSVFARERRSSLLCSPVVCVFRPDLTSYHRSKISLFFSPVFLVWSAPLGARGPCLGLAPALGPAPGGASHARGQSSPVQVRSTSYLTHTRTRTFLSWGESRGRASRTYYTPPPPPPQLSIGSEEGDGAGPGGKKGDRRPQRVDLTS